MKWLLDGETARARPDRKFTIARYPQPGQEKPGQRVQYALWKSPPSPQVGGTFVASVSAPADDAALQLAAIEFLKAQSERLEPSATPATEEPGNG